MHVRRRFEVALAFAVVACSGAQVAPGAATEGGSTVASSPLPCDVAEAFARNCQSCHAEATKFGAPMPLVTYQDTQAAAKSDGAKKVWELVGQRVADPLRPMPPSGAMSEGDKAALLGWASAGAPAGGANCAPAVAAPSASDVGPAHLPCPAEEQATFVAHGADPASKFAVPVDAGNLNMCFTWRAPWKGETQATAFAPIIDDARVLHHWILFETSTPQTEGGFGNCKMPLDATFLTGWAPGGANRTMPPDIGLALPDGTQGKWLILQMHYWNVARHADAQDRSGVALCTTKPGAPRPKTAVVATLGTLGIAIPPRASGHEVTGSCTPELTEPAHVIGSGPHMHQRGKTIKTTVLRGGDPARAETLVDVGRWDFEGQTTYPSEMIIQPGDVLKTSCTYDNPSNQRVFFGERTEDEMCFNFVTVWPPPGLVSAGGAVSRRCIGR